MSVLLQRIGRLLLGIPSRADGPTMPLATAHYARAAKTLRRAAGRSAGAAAAPLPGPSFLDDEPADAAGDQTASTTLAAGRPSTE